MKLMFFFENMQIVTHSTDFSFFLTVSKIEEQKNSIYKYSLCDNLLKKTFPDIEGNLTCFILTERHLVFSLMDENSTYIYDLCTNFLVKKLDYYLFFNGNKINSKQTLFLGKAEKTFIIDLNNGDILKYVENVDKKRRNKVHKDCMIYYQGKLIECYNFDNDILLWQLDLGNAGNYYCTIWERNEIGKFGSLEFHENLIFILIGKSVLGVDFETGKILWQKDDVGRYTKVTVIGEKVLVSGGFGFQWLDLETITFDSEMVLLEKFHNGDYEQYPDGGEITYHKSQLWFPVYTRGKRFLGVYDPQSGQLIRKFDFPDGERLGEPYFHEDKIYINTSEGDLYILEDN